MTTTPTPAPEAAPKKKTVTKHKYVVAEGAIAPYGNAFGTTNPEARMYQPGEVVSLTPAMAKHYLALKRLDPFIEDEEGAENGDDQ